MTRIISTDEYITVMILLQDLINTAPIESLRSLNELVDVMIELKDLDHNVQTINIALDK